MSNVLTKKDLRRCLNRYIFTRQSPFNYETMQSGGWVYSIHPAMEKIYDGDADLLAEKYKDHFKFYNTHPWMGNIILGACIAIESTKDPDATKQAVEMRTALMGPLAGLGDSFFWGTLRLIATGIGTSLALKGNAIIWIMFMTILGAIAAYMALEGSIVGWVIAEAIQLVIWFAFYKLFFVAYEQGVTFVTTRSAQLQHITEAASVLGLSLVGALVASTVNVKFGITMSYGEVVQPVNDLLDSIIPHFGNVVTVALIYWGLGRKSMTSGKMIIIVLVAAIVLSAIGILA